jgi:hypothetical protein
VTLEDPGEDLALETPGEKIPALADPGLEAER